MCGRFAQPRSSEDLARIFRARVAAPLPGEQFNVAPTDEVSAVLERDADRLVDAFRWGLVPHWADGVGGAARRINARAETVERSPAYRAAFRGRRCIIPADAFYEWRRGSGMRRPQPYAVERVDGAVMALAGLWARWRDPTSGTRLATVAILTTIPNAVVADIHDRMPVILEPEDWNTWLDERTPAHDLRPLLGPAPDDALRMRAVSPAVNDVRSEGPQLLAPWTPEPAAAQPIRPA